MPANPRADRYSHTPRKVFDKAMDRLHVRLVRLKEDYRADLLIIFHRVQALEEALTELMDPPQKNQQLENTHRFLTDVSDTEEL